MADQEFSVVRPDDLLVVGVELYNARLSEDGTQLVRVDVNQPASIVLRLPTQHFREPVSTVEIVGEGPVEHRQPPLSSVPLAAGRRSRLEFGFPDGVTQLPVTPGLLALLETLAPDLSGTYVDFPAGLSTSPVADRWDLGLDARGYGNDPLWTAKPRVPRGVPVSLTWFSQYPIRDNLGGTTPPRDRPPHQDYRASRIVLTALGATISMTSTPTDTYEHRAALGRDVHVRTVTSGRLSSGHRASVITVIDRSLRRARMLHGPSLDVFEERVIGSLVGSTVVIVTETLLDLSAAPYPYGGREMPFTTLRLTGTPVAVDPADLSRPRLLTLGNAPVPFELAATDRSGHTITMTTPLAFVPDGPVEAAEVNAVLANTRAAVHPVPVTLADTHASDTVLSGAELRVVQVGDDFLPTVATLDVVLDAMAGFTGVAPTRKAILAEPYLTRQPNPTGRFVDLIEPVALDLGVAAAGGLARIGGNVEALTTERGATPMAFANDARFADVQALRAVLGSPTLFGRIDLLSLVDARAVTTGPQLTRQVTAEGDRFGYQFTAPLDSAAAGVLDTANVTAKGTLTLDAWVLRATDGRPLAARSSGTITGITVRVAGIVEIVFERITFTSDGGGKTSVDVGRPTLRFLGALSFLQEIAESLARTGLGSGVRIEQDASGVKAGFGIEVPTVAVGVFQLSHLSVDSWVRVPLRDEPMSFSLAIASKQRPFIATVAMFGGGGYLALELTTEGMRSLEVAIEFGGSMCLDIVVASGGVTVMAGIYFSLREGQQEFRGYVRCGGYLSVLGIITIAVEFYLELHYSVKTDSAGKKHQVFGGRASLTVSVEVLLFSKSVTLTVEREFIGSAADPPFLECVSESDWDIYCDAFAEEQAFAEELV